MKTKNFYILFIIIFFIFAISIKSFSQIIIVNKNSPRDSITTEELKDIFMGKKLFYGDFKKPIKIHPVYYGEKELKDKMFSLINTSEINFKKNWIRLTLTGKAKPPIIFDTEAEVIDYVAENDGGIGIIDALKVENKNIKIIKIIK